MPSVLQRIIALSSILALMLSSTKSEEFVSKDEMVESLFYEQCPVAKARNLPFELILANSSAAPVKIVPLVRLHRIVSVNDLTQTMVFFMEIWLDWFYPCSPLQFDIPKLYEEKAESIVVFHYNKTRTWYPGVRHMNAAYNANPFDDMTAYPTVYPLMSPLPCGEIGYVGTFESNCDAFSFARFPFDKLSCSVNLETTDDTMVYIFANISFESDPSSQILGGTDIWEFEPPLYSYITSIPRSFGITVSRATFGINLQRRYNYFIGNVILPVAVLFVLQIMALFIEPDAPDRAAFCMTNVLAFAFILSMVFGLIPKTSERVFIVELVEAKLIICVLITMYSLVTQPIAGNDWATKNVSFLRKRVKISVIRIIDLAVGLSTLATAGITYGIYVNQMIN